MKTKKWLIPIVIMVAILISSVTVLLISGNQLTVARCIVTDGDCLYMVYNDRPIHLAYDKDADFKTGDRLLVLHQSAFAESYPEQTKAYFIIKIGSGSMDDIPQKAIDVLIQTKNWNE